jgi:5-methylcytosine-specific restriction endonuclease McrA
MKRCRLTKAQRVAMRTNLFELQGRKCCYCGRFVYLDFHHGPQTATLEHLRRLKDGGDDHRDNLALACIRCNSMRGERSWVEFATLMQQQPVPANSNFATIPHLGPVA